MKLRKKLAVVLAAATVMSVVPVVTHAASQNRVTKNITVIKDTEFSSTTTAPAIVIEAKDARTGEEFLVELENAEWLDWDANATSPIELAGTENVTVIILGPKTAKATVAYEGARKDIKIPLLTKVGEGVAKVHIDGGSSTITSDSHQFAATPGKTEKIAFTVKEAKTFFDKGVLSDIVIEENLSGSLINGGEFKMTLNHRDFEFVVPRGGVIEVEGGKGFAGKTLEATVEYGRYDNELIVKLPRVNSSLKGTLTLKGIEVESTVRTPKLGDLTVDITGDSIGTHRNVKMANVSEYGTAIEGTSKDVYAGQRAVIEFDIQEKVSDSLREGRLLEVSLEQGYFTERVLDRNDRYDEEATMAALASIVNVKEGRSTISLLDLEKVQPITKNDKVIGFAFNVRDFKGLSFKAEIDVPLSAEGKVSVVLEGRALESSNSLKAEVLNVEKPFNIETTAHEILAGVSRQKGGKIVITEKEKGLFTYGEKIQISLPKDFRYSKEPTVEVTTGDLEIGRVQYSTNSDDQPVLEIEVKRDSRTASTIEIKDFEVTASGFAPIGDYSMSIGGKALSVTDSVVEFEDFFKVVSEKTVETVVNEVSFVIGSAAYVANGTTKTMDVAPFLSKDGNTIVPLRYVAEALGIQEENIIWDGVNRTVTILDGAKVLQLKIDSKMVMFNGVSIPMNSAPTIVNERSCVPVGEIGRLLGADVDWDPVTKTATFKR